MNSWGQRFFFTICISNRVFQATGELSSLLYCLRLTPCKWSRCQTPINQHLRQSSVVDIVVKANPNLPHPIVSNCETVAYPSVECFVKRKERSQPLCWRKAEGPLAFVENSITSLAHLPANDHQLSAIKISCRRPVCHSAGFPLCVSAFTCKYFGNRLTIKLLTWLTMVTVDPFINQSVLMPSFYSRCCEKPKCAKS